MANHKSKYQEPKQLQNNFNSVNYVIPSLFVKHVRVNSRCKFRVIYYCQQKNKTQRMLLFFNASIRKIVVNSLDIRYQTFFIQVLSFVS